MAINLTLNNKNNISNLICFDTCPNIVSIENDSATDTYEYRKYDANNLATTGSNEKIIINGYAINGTSSLDNLYGRNFLSNGKDFPESCAISIVNALKNIPQLDMNYNIVYEGAATLSITAKNPGSKYRLNVVLDNIVNFDEIDSTSGSSNDDLVGDTSSRVYVDIYYNDKDTQRVINSGNKEIDFKFLTTLQKEYYRKSLSFNVTPALMSVSNSNNTTVWKAFIYAVVDGQYQQIGTISDNYVINGYLVNQGNTYINANGVSNRTIPALNVARGEDKTSYNKSILYVYEPSFYISLYKINGITSENITISYLESDETEITATTKAITLTSDKNIDTYKIDFDENTMRDSYYIDLTFSFGTIRLNVINPPFANADCNRVYWYNSYGGVSFFDFVGEKKEDRKTEVETYNKSLLDFYKNDKQEQEVVYFRENSITVSLTTHLMDKDGLYQLYDLQNSYKAWITINGVNYYIIITSLTVEEPSYNIFTATIKYNYSLLDSFA